MVVLFSGRSRVTVFGAHGRARIRSVCAWPDLFCSTRLRSLHRASSQRADKLFALFKHPVFEEISISKWLAGNPASLVAIPLAYPGRQLAFAEKGSGDHQIIDPSAQDEIGLDKSDQKEHKLEWSDKRAIGPFETAFMSIAKTDVDVVRKSKVYEKIAHQIQRLIRDGLLKPGDKLPPERELAEMFQVSRSSLRDAIRALELMGLVEPRQGEGTVVLAPSAESLINPLAAALLPERDLVSELLEFREMIEPTLAGRAAVYASSGDLDLLKDILRRQKQKVDRGELAIEEDSEFHYAIAKAAKNSVVLRVLDAFMDLLRESREQSLQVEGRLQKSLEGHGRIFQAIQRGDSSTAENAMRQHIKEIESIVLNKR